MNAYTISIHLEGDGLSETQIEKINEMMSEYKDLKVEDGKTYSADDVRAIIAVASKKPSPNPLMPEPSEIVWGGLAFLVVFAFLAKFALPAAKKAMDARSAKIAGDLSAAEAAKAAADKEAATYRAQIGDAKGEGAQIVDAARAQAETVRKDIIARAESEAADIRAKATADADAQGDRVKVELQSHVRNLSIDLAEKVVGKNLDRATNEALVDQYISQLAR